MASVHGPQGRQQQLPGVGEGYGADLRDVVPLPDDGILEEVVEEEGRDLLQGDEVCGGVQQEAHEEGVPAHGVDLRRLECVEQHVERRGQGAERQRTTCARHKPGSGGATPPK